ncbi:MAG: hypothetical protein SCH39_13315 [Methanosarcinales archaeon]|nr:hypothetical protein [Methanosarcinales archaeon]
MATLHHLPPLAFAPALPPHHKKGRLGEIQEGGRRVHEQMGAGSMQNKCGVGF